MLQNRNKLVLAAAIYFHTSFIFPGKARSLPLEWSFLGAAPALPAIIRLWWKWITVANTLAYFNAAIEVVKGFIVQTPGAYIIKLITAVIYGFYVIS